LAPGSVLSDPNRPFAMGPNGQVTPNMPFQQYEIDRARAGATKVSQTSVTRQEGEEAKTVGKFFGDAYADIQKAGFNAGSRINRASRLSQLLENVNTGKLTAAGTEVAAFADSLGFKIDKNLGNKQAAVALTNEMALELRNPAGGAGMPGAMSDSDREFLRSMVPGLGTTPEGRRLMLETSTKLAKRDQDVARIAREYRKKNGNLDEGFYEELSRFSASNPLFQSAPSVPGSAPRVVDFNSLPKGKN